MAGREIGPPPSVIDKFNYVWRDWLNLVYQKVNKRTYTMTIPFTQSQGHASSPMAAGLLNFSPVHLADDTTDEYQYFGFSLPENWIPGTNLDLYIRYSTLVTQSGVKTINTSLTLATKNIGGFITGDNGTFNNFVTLELNAPSNKFRETTVFALPQNTLELGDTVFLQVYRRATTDSCVGDVAYIHLYIEYQGYINHE